MWPCPAAGLVWQQVQAGEAVHIWTICGGAPDPSRPFSPFAQSLHERWGTGPAAVAARRQEDLASCRVMGAPGRHLAVFDCIYRTSAEGAGLLCQRRGVERPAAPRRGRQCSRNQPSFRPARLPRRCPGGLPAQPGGSCGSPAHPPGSRADRPPAVVLRRLPVCAQAARPVGGTAPGWLEAGDLSHLCSRVGSLAGGRSSACFPDQHLLDGSKPPCEQRLPITGPRRGDCPVANGVKP